MDVWRHEGGTVDCWQVAEAYRCFRAGAAACPEDESLVHYQRVFETFDAETQTTDAAHQKTLRSIDRGSFLSLDVPADAAPAAVVAAEGGSLKLVHASKRPLFDASECARLIAAATERAASRGWTTDRHVDAPTCDVACFDLADEAVAWTREQLRRTLYPAVCALFPGVVPDGRLLRCQDCFVVRYDGGGGAPPPPSAPAGVAAGAAAAAPAAAESARAAAAAPGFASLKPHKTSRSSA